MANNTPVVGLTDAFEFASVSSPSTYTTLNGVTSAAITGDKVQTEKTTTLATTNGVDTYIASTQEPGSIDLKGLFYPGDSTQVAFEAIRAAGVAVNVKLTYGSSNSCSCSAIIESFTPNLGSADKLSTFDAKLKITGPKTYA